MKIIRITRPSRLTGNYGGTFSVLPLWPVASFLSLYGMPFGTLPIFRGLFILLKIWEVSLLGFWLYGKPTVAVVNFKNIEAEIIPL